MEKFEVHYQMCCLVDISAKNKDEAVEKATEKLERALRKNGEIIQFAEVTDVIQQKTPLGQTKATKLDELKRDVDSSFDALMADIKL